MSRRFANALNRAGKYSTRSRFVIPDPAGGNCFVELATGEQHENAAVVLVGVELTIDDVVAKIRANGMDAESAKPVIRNQWGQTPLILLGRSQCSLP